MPERKRNWARPHTRPSSRVYGLSGEALLNFGPLGVILYASPYWVPSLDGTEKSSRVGIRTDARMFLAPFFSSDVLDSSYGDSDNLVFAAVTQGALIVTAIFVGIGPATVEREDSFCQEYWLRLKTTFRGTDDGRILRQRTGRVFVWAQLLDAFNDVVLLARVCKGNGAHDEGTPLKVDLFRFVNCRTILGPSQYLLGLPQLRYRVRQAVSQCDAFILRVPGL